MGRRKGSGAAEKSNVIVGDHAYGSHRSRVVGNDSGIAGRKDQSGGSLGSSTRTR